MRFDDVELELDPHVSGPDAGTCDVTVTFTAVWDAYEQASNLPYQVWVWLFGDDTWGGGTEDGVDDAIDTGALPDLEISSGGERTTDHSYSYRHTDLGRFDEDTDDEGWDEIRAKLTARVKEPDVVVAESRNHVGLKL